MAIELKRPVRVGDTIKVHATGHLRKVRVTKVTDTYIWVEYTSPSTGTYHNTKFHRDWALEGTELY